MKYFMKFKVLVFSSMVLGNAASAQVIYPKINYSLPANIKESSGIARYGNQLLTMNDGGNKNEIFLIDSTGKLKYTVPLEGVTNNDWEDIAVYGKKILLADIGNNLNNRKNLCVYKFSINNNKAGSVKKYKISYADQNAFPPRNERKNFDAEAIIAWKDSVFIFSKDRSSPYTGYTKMYAFNSDESSDLKLLPLDSFQTGTKGFITNSVTGAAISPDGKIMALTSCFCLYVFFDYASGEFFNGKFAMFRYSDFTQKEAICFKSHDEIYVTDEEVLGLGGRLLSYNFGDYLTGKKNYYTPAVEQCSVKFNKERSKILITCKVKEAVPLMIEIHDISGKIVYTTKGSSGKLNAEIATNKSFKKGYYRVFSGNQLLYAYRLE